MFYITDYITKMDVKTYEMLSLLSRAVSSVPSASDSPAKDRAKTLLHKCLAQFSRQQQIHAQQAARYLRGHGDSISSHKTVPMLTGLLLNFLQTEYGLGSDENDEDADDSDVEQCSLKIQTDCHGRLVSRNQVLDYWYRSDALADMNFYEFTRCVAIETQAKAKGALKPDAWLGTLKHHLLKDEHPLSETHVLVEHTNDLRGDGGTHLVPRIVGSFIPREKAGDKWALFTLAHFKPFSNAIPIVEPGMTLDQAYKNFEFSPRSRFVMNNWETVHECQDERDAEWLHKRAALTSQSLAMTQALSTALPTDPDDIDVAAPMKQSAKNDFKTLQIVQVLEQSQWLTSNAKANTTSDRSSTSVKQTFPEPTTLTLKNWMQEVKRQETIIAHARRNVQETMPDALHVLPTESGATVQTAEHHTNLDCPPTDTTPVYGPNNVLSAEDVIEKVGKEFELNEKQWVAFRIIARSFVSRYVEETDTETEPLRMLMTGPGGTGKTHIVKAVQKVMDYYGCAHKIRFLAPTGSAASLINGMTIHKGLGIKVKSKEKGKGNRKLGDNIEDYSVIISIQNRTKLRDEWRDVVVLLVDECSLVGCELMSELDSALRFAKEKADQWFGGITVIFAGDFYQYPPVGGTALYTPISPYTAQSNEEIAKRLGRLAWKTINSVVTLTEQKCMEKDPNMELPYNVFGYVNAPWRM